MPAPGRRRVEARDEAGIVRAVERARASGRRLRPVGAGGSKSGVNEPPGLELRLEPPARLLEVDGARVTAPAGLSTGRLQSLLADHGLSLPTVGEWKTGTVAGALATGTHGGSARHGILSTSLAGLRMVTGTGDVVELGPGDPDFAHAGVSLGALGVLSRVTLICEDRFALRLETDVVPFREYRREPVAQESRTEFHASLWMPWADRVVRFAAERAPDPGRRVSRKPRFGVRTAVASFLSRRLGWEGAVSDRVFGRTAVDDAAEILAPLEVSGRKARFRNVANEIRGRNAAELAVPAARAGEALERLGALFARRPGPLNNPIGLRVNPGDGFSLSPCAGRDTLWLDVFYDDDGPFERGLAAAGEALDARCHWGKTLALPPAALRRTYPEWEAFRAARERLDPAGLFASPFTDRLGLTAETGGARASGPTREAEPAPARESGPTGDAGP